MNRSLIIILAFGLAASIAHSDTPSNDAEMEALIADGQANALAEMMEDQLKTGDASPATYYWLGRAELALIDDASALRKLGLARSAKKNLEEAVALEPELVPARVSLARYYLEAPAIAGGSRAAAREQANQLMTMDPPSAFRINASIAQEDEDYDQAIDWLSKALAAQTWDWNTQYELITLAVHRQVTSAETVLNQADENVESYATDPDALFPLIGYQRGKLAAVTGTYLEPGHAALEEYLQHTPADGEPGLDWAQFRLSQVERQMGLTDEALARLEQLETVEVPENLSFAIQDERRWHYSD